MPRYNSDEFFRAERRGRPRKREEDLRYKDYHLKLTSEEFDILDEAAETNNMTKADLIRTGLACMGVQINPSNKIKRR